MRLFVIITHEDVKVNNFDNLDHFFISLCYFISSKSKDIRTQVGAAIVSPENDSYVTGYNGFPRGLEENTKRLKKPLKYVYTEHAERNAIYNCARKGIATKGSRIYITCLPCSDCARGIIQAGITEVVYHHNHPMNLEEGRQKVNEQLRSMFQECGIKLRGYSGKISPVIQVLYNGSLFDPNDFA